MNARSQILLLISSLGVGFASAASAAGQLADDPRWYIAPQGTYVWPDSNRHAGNHTGVRLDVGFQLYPAWDLEFGINDYQLNFDSPLTGSGHQTALGADGLWYFMGRSRAFSPFGLLGAGVADQNQSTGGNSTNAYATLGLGFLSSPWAWDGAIRVSVQHLKYIGDGSFGDTIASIGLQIPIGSRTEPTQVAATQPPASLATPVEMSPELETAAVVPPVIELRGVKFANDSDVILPESGPALDEAVQTLNKHPNLQVQVAGFTDDVGDAAYNVDLSHRRAEAVEKYLIDHGIATERLSAKGYGEDYPIAPNDTPEGRAENRRVELIVQGPGG